MMTKSIEQTTRRLLDKVSPEPMSGCWLWLGQIRAGGYGNFWLKGNRAAHRAAYELLIGKIPEGLDLDHLCRNRCCVNPAHLEPVTRSENLKRGIGVGAAGREVNKSKTHCPKGHPYSGWNLYVAPSGVGGRRCRACNKARYVRRSEAR